MGVSYLYIPLWFYYGIEGVVTGDDAGQTLHSTVVLLWEVMLSLNLVVSINFTFHCGSIMGS